MCLSGGQFSGFGWIIGCIVVFGLWGLVWGLFGVIILICLCRYYFIDIVLSIVLYRFIPLHLLFDIFVLIYSYRYSFIDMNVSVYLYRYKQGYFLPFECLFFMQNNIRSNVLKIRGYIKTFVWKTFVWKQTVWFI